MYTTKNLTIDQGTTFSENLYYLDSSNVPIPLANYTLDGQIQKSFTSANITAVFSTSIIDSTNAKFTISLTSGVTANISSGRYVYSVFGRTSNTVVKIYEGIVTVNPSAIATGIGPATVGNTVPTFLTTFISANYISKAILKSLVASSNTWTEYQANIAAL